MANPTINDVIKVLNAHGFDLIPVNRDGLAINDEPKYKIVKK